MPAIRKKTEMKTLKMNVFLKSDFLFTNDDPFTGDSPTSFSLEKYGSKKIPSYSIRVRTRNNFDERNTRVHISNP